MDTQSFEAKAKQRLDSRVRQHAGLARHAGAVGGKCDDMWLVSKVR